MEMPMRDFQRSVALAPSLVLFSQYRRRPKPASLEKL
jgi:hypothetical protein